MSSKHCWDQWDKGSPTQEDDQCEAWHQSSPLCRVLLPHIHWLWLLWYILIPSCAPLLSVHPSPFIIPLHPQLNHIYQSCSFSIISHHNGSVCWEIMRCHIGQVWSQISSTGHSSAVIVQRGRSFVCGRTEILASDPACEWNEVTKEECARCSLQWGWA